MSIKIGSIGYNHSHGADFKQDLPNGPGAFLFLLVKSPSVFYIKDKRYNVMKNSYLILRPATRCFYKAQKDNYVDDWFYFHFEEAGDEEELLKHGLLFDQPVFLGNTDELSTIIHQISYEHFSNDDYHETIKDLLTKIFFYKLARIIKSDRIASSDVLASKNDKISYLRTRLFEQPDLFSNVDEMADFVGLSRSGFQHLYTKNFGVSVIKDVISGRIEKAKSYLVKTSLTISEIASKCGYKSDFHFMRQFKEQTGLTPTEYRNGSTWLHIQNVT